MLLLYSILGVEESLKNFTMRSEAETLNRLNLRVKSLKEAVFNTHDGLKKRVNLSSSKRPAESFYKFG